MSEVIVHARYDGQVFRPEEPIDLVPDAVYKITIDTGRRIEGRETIWDVLDRHVGSVDAPEDWSAEHDHYLYGTPKRNERGQG